MFIPLISFGQTKPIKIEVKQTSSFPQNFNQITEASAAARASRAASASAASEALKNNYEKIQVDLLKNTPDKYKYIAIQKLSGWAVIRNYETIKTEIKNAQKYILVNDLDKIKGKSKIDKSELFEPEIPPSYLSNSETLFLEWTREDLSYNDRLSRLLLKNSDGETVYQAEYKNKGYTEMLRPVLSDYRITKEDAKKQLIELKEYLDLEIITQEEFNKKATSLKKILLGN